MNRDIHTKDGGIVAEYQYLPVLAENVKKISA